MRRVLIAVAALYAIVFIVVARRASLPSFAPLSAVERDAVIERLRGRAPATQGAIGGATRRAILDRPLAGGGPVVATLWDRGEPIARVEGRGTTLALAVDDAASALARQSVDTTRRERARLKVDVVLARAPIATAPTALLALSVVPGMDGVGLAVDDREHLLLADDLLRDDLAAAYAPVRGMEFTLGLDGPAVLRRLVSDSGLDRAAFRRASKRWFRFRADSFIEPASPPSSQSVRATTPALPVVRGNTPGPSLSSEALKSAAIAGGDYLARHLRPDGQFDYEYWTARGQVAMAGYSIPRHAGATWYLAQIYRATGDPRFLDAAERAEAWLQEAHPPGCDGPRACIGEPGADVVDLGSAALALVAESELERAHPSESRRRFMQRLTDFVLAMQKPDGDFCHLYRPQTATRDEHTKMLYYSGEAAYALARLTALGPSFATPHLVEALDHALAYLTDRQYRPFALRFYFMEDHWTCMAVEAGWDALPTERRESYAKFCDQFVAFLGRTQFHEGDPIVDAQPDFAGAYGFSPLLPPHGTPVGSRSETTLSTYLLQKRRGLPEATLAATRRQIDDGLRFLLGHQIQDDSAYLMADPDAARGGFLMSDVARYVRIDFVQHACSAMLRAALLL
jgi:hypothetical protein